MSNVSLTGDDNGRSLALREGDVVAIQLAENPTTGFRWDVDHVDEGVELIDDTYSPGAAPQFGSGGLREFRFRYRGLAPTRITLKNWRSWEGESSVVARFTVELLPEE
jgi:inhibitor of cysteine peptidase